MSKVDALLELERRGSLPPEGAALLGELRKRGMIEGGAAQEQPQPSESQQRVDEMPSFMRAALGAGEAGLQAVTGLGASVAGGLAGLADTGLSLAGRGSGAPGETVRKVQQLGTYQPRTTQGQTASSVLGFPFELYSKGVNWAGDQVRGGDSGGVRDFLGTTTAVAGESLPALVGGVAALRGASRATPAPLTLKQETLKAAQKEGYTVPPSMADRPSWLEGTGGKIRTAQLHSARNAEVTSKIAARELGMPEGNALTPEILQKYRDGLYREGYLPLKQNPAPLMADEAYWAEVGKPVAEINKVRQSFPEAKIAGADEITSLSDGLMNTNRMSYEAAIERIRQLRFEAKKNLKAYDDPAKSRLGQAQSASAKALEDLIERNLEKTGDTAQLVKYRMAREHIAKSHTVEDALNPATGEVSARSLAKAPYVSGGFKTAADFANAFPKAAQDPRMIGGTPPISPLDVSMGSVMGIAGATATGGPAGFMAAGLPLLRPVAAPMTMSPLVQRSLIRNPTPTPPEIGLLPLVSEPADRRRLLQ